MGSFGAWSGSESSEHTPNSLARQPCCRKVMFKVMFMEQRTIAMGHRAILGDRFQVGLRLLIFLMAGLWGGDLQAVEVQGRILDPQGRGFSGVLVEVEQVRTAAESGRQILTQATAPGPVARSKTDRRGEYRLRLPGPGFYRLQVGAKHFLPAAFELAPVLEDRRLPDLALTRTTSLEVRLGEEDGLPGVEIRARGWSSRWREKAREGWWPADRRVKTRRTGKAQVPCSPGERVSLTAVHEGRHYYGVADCENQPIRLPGTPLRTVLLRHADGQPAEGVLAFLRWPWTPLAESDAEGRLHLPFDEEGTRPLVFVDQGGVYGEAHRGADSVAKESPTWVLPAVETIRGTVRDALTGVPLEGAWAWRGRGVLHHTQTDSEGRFRLHRPVVGEARLKAAYPGYLVAEERPPTVELSLIPGGRREGRLIDPSGRPIPRVQVRLVTVGPPNGEAATIPLPMETETDEEGRFTLQGVAPFVEYRLEARRWGFEASAWLVEPLEPGVKEEPLELVLEPSRRAYGLVLTEDDVPLPGAQVEFFSAIRGAGSGQDFSASRKQSARPWRATTDEGGRFVILEPPAGTFYLAARAPGYPELLVPGLEIPEEERSVDLGTVWLVPGVELSGHVTDRDGQPLAGAKIDLRKADGGPVVMTRPGSVWFSSTTSGVEGEYRLVGLPQGAQLYLLAQAEGYLAREVPLLTGEEDQEIDLELDAACAARGRVVDAEGLPLDRIRIVASPPGGGGRRVAYSSQGEFDFHALVCGASYEFFAETDSGASEARRVHLTAPGIEDLHFELRDRAGLEVRLVDAEGTGLSGVRLYIQGIESESRSRLAFSRSDGSFVWRFLDPGAYRVWAEPNGYPAQEGKVVLTMGQRTSLILRFSREAEGAERTVRGRVLDSQGWGIPGATVRLQGEGRLQTMESREDGSFEFRAAEGRYRLSAHDEGYAPYSGAPFALDRDLQSLDLTLSEGVTVTGSLHGIDPASLGNVAIKALSALDVYYGTVRYDGEYRIDHLGTGQWLILAELSDPPRRARSEVELGPGDRQVRLDLHFETGHRVSGLAWSDGKALEHGIVEVRCGGGFHGRTFTDAEGSFVLEDVPSGSCRAKLRDPARDRQTEEAFEVTGDAWWVLEIPQSSP